MTEQQLERANAIMEEVDRLKISLGNIDRFEQDVPNLKCKYTRVTLLGVCALDVQMPLELSGQITRALRSALQGKIAQYKKEFEEL